MTTFQDYPAQTMAPNENDFPLFPYPDAWSDHTYEPYPDQSYMNTTSFDSYQTHPAYIPTDQYTFGADNSFQPKTHLHPYHSPANSAAQSFDVQQPPVLSSTSDSGASAPSTISSAMGSPSMHPQLVNNWGQQPDMGMIPDIVHPDNLGQDVFASTGFDMESIPAVTDKGCVGELHNFSSSQPAISAPLSNVSSYRSSFDFLRDAGPIPPTWMDSQMSNAFPITNVQTSSSMPLTITPPASGNMSPSDSLFRSPTTPASATSPVLERVKGKRKASVAQSAPKRLRGSSPLTQAMSYNEADLPPRPQAPKNSLSSPFFSQSSGYFVPPLESSCPSPALLSYFFSLFHDTSGQRDLNVG